MIPYVANRRGPIIGLEALALQGLPVEELLLTRESEAQLADLAGNAMYGRSLCPLLFRTCI